MGKARVKSFGITVEFPTEEDAIEDAKMIYENNLRSNPVVYNESGWMIWSKGQRLDVNGIPENEWS
jgi:hypothetical protein